MLLISCKYMCIAYWLEPTGYTEVLHDHMYIDDQNSNSFCV